jgi:hypothetical protein
MVLATLTLTRRRRDKFAAASESFVMIARGWVRSRAFLLIKPPQEHFGAQNSSAPVLLPAVVLGDPLIFVRGGMLLQSAFPALQLDG